MGGTLFFFVDLTGSFSFVWYCNPTPLQYQRNEKLPVKSTKKEYCTAHETFGIATGWGPSPAKHY